MRRQEAFERLAAHRQELAAMGVATLAIFGSVARDTARPDSDVDLLITFSRSVGLFAFARVQLRLEQILGCRVDLVTPDAIRTEMRGQILSGAVYAE